MKLAHCLTRALAVAVLAGSCSWAMAQSAAGSVLRLTVPYGTGSATDAISRALAPVLGTSLGLSSIVENAPAANGIPASTAFVNRPYDPNSLLVIAANHVVNPSLFSNVPYDPVRDFKPLARLGHIPFVLSVHPDVPVSNLAELIAYLKARPGKVDYASPGNGSPPHLAMELFKSMAGLHVVHIPYRGAGDANANLMGGQVSLAFVVESAAVTQSRAGRIKPIAISSSRRSANLPAVPTLAEAGVPGFELVSWIGLLGHKDTPAAQQEKVSRLIVQAMQRPELAAQVTKMGLTIDLLAGSAFERYMAAERDKWAGIVKTSGTRLD